MPTRVLILSASIGEGHDLPARMLAAGLEQAQPGIDAPVLDALPAMGKISMLVADDASVLMFDRMNWLFDASYVLLARFPPSRALAKWLTHHIAGPGLARLIDAQRPDVVVSTYPGATEALGYLRGRGRIRVPVVSVITDLSALQFWAHPDIDLHLITEEESFAEVRSIAPHTQVACVRGLTDPTFEQPLDPLVARRSLGLPEEGPVIVVSGGGWAVGDLGGAAQEGLDADPRATVLALCGRSEPVRGALAERFADEPRMRVMGFTDRMGDVLGAADVLIHSTAGLTVFEARVRGCRVISYGWGVAHIRLNNQAYEQFGLVRVAGDRAALAAALRAALAEPRRPDATYAARRSAAEAVLALLAAGDPAAPAAVAA